ncbi:MAG: 3,4-dihydroxy-2-butanone-4-phosphate synthase [Planctomycetaceae bacterium]
MRNLFSSVEQAIEAVAQGRIIVVVDSEDREDEGDFFIAAELVTPRTIHFMISEARGQLCMPVMPDIAQRLALKSMVPPNGDGDRPRFAIPIDHRTCRSGISPLERACTIRAIVDSTSGPDDFGRPGHIFPLIAEPNGVLTRQGHTEAAVDLARLAGLTPAGVLCEICSNDGLHTADRPELIRVARRFGLHIITIDDLIAYRRRNPEGRSVAGRNGVAKAASIGVNP